VRRIDEPAAQAHVIGAIADISPEAVGCIIFPAEDLIALGGPELFFLLEAGAFRVARIWARAITASAARITTEETATGSVATQAQRRGRASMAILIMPE